ncbi:hypothetical protein [Vibrio phage PG216]|nr:hypothetical protein [Vibrio phage PG216]
MSALFCIIQLLKRNKENHYDYSNSIRRSNVHHSITRASKRNAPVHVRRKQNYDADVRRSYQLNQSVLYREVRKLLPITTGEINHVTNRYAIDITMLCNTHWH